MSAGGGAYDSDDNYEKLDLPDFFINIIGGKDNIKIRRNIVNPDYEGPERRKLEKSLAKEKLEAVKDI